MAVEAPVKTPRSEPALAVVEPLHAVSGGAQSNAPLEAAAQFPWPQSELPEYVSWEEFARFPNFWEGHILGGLLKNEGIPIIIEFLWPGVDLKSYSVVWVPRELAHRARWILAWPAPSEEELIFLATGELPSAQESESGVK